MANVKESCRQTRKSPLKDKQSRKRQKLSPDDVEVVASGPALKYFAAVYNEFTKAMDLTGISEELKQKLYKVAPVLQGQRGIYTKDFFTDVVGLCGSGVLVGKLKGYEDEIRVKWPERKRRYEIVECLDSDEAAFFADHWSKVYGDSPDNNYFSMRFLRGCYANLVHNIDVNWAQEALDRRRHREKKLDKNPNKLEPIALRQQIGAICKLVVSVEANPDLGMKNLAAAEAELQQCQEDGVKAQNHKRSLLEKLKASKEGLESLYAAEEFDDLHVCYSKAIVEVKILRTKGTAKEASAKRAEAEALLAAINSSSEKSKMLEDTISNIEEELLPKAIAQLKSTKELLEKASERVKELTTCPGCKDALAKREKKVDCAPSVDPPSPLTVVANVDLPSAPNAEAILNLPSPPDAAVDTHQ